MNWPTVPDELAMPFGNRDERETSSNHGLHAYPPATTNVFARNVTGTLPSRLTASAASMREPRSATVSLRTSVREKSSTRFVRRSAFQVKSGEYFAPTG